MECLKCGANVLESNATFCPECGERLYGKISCPSCGQCIDGKYTYCVFCGARVDEESHSPISDTVSTENNAKNIVTENDKDSTAVFAWFRAGLGLALTVLALVFVFMIGFQFNLYGSTYAFEEFALKTNTDDIKLFYYFSDAYKEIAELKEREVFDHELPIMGGYIHAIVGTVVSVATIGCVVGFAVPAIIGFVKFAVTRVENNGGKWAVRSVIAYLAGAVALRVLNICTTDIDLVSHINAVIGKSLKASTIIRFDNPTGIGLVLCIVFLLLYALINCLRKGKEWQNKKTVFNFAFSLLATAFAIVVCAVGQNATVGTTLTTTEGFEQTITFTMSQLPFSSFLVSSFEFGANASFYTKHLNEINTSYAFAVVQEFMSLGVVACSLCAIASRIFETEGRAKGTLLFSILTAVFAVAQLVAGIVSQSIMHELYAKLINTETDSIVTALLLGNSIITVVFAGLQLITAIIHTMISKIIK